MIQEAEEYAETDRLQRERVEKRNRAEALTFQAERLLREVALDFGMQFARDRRRRIEGLVQELRDYLEQGDERGIDIAQAELQDELYDLNREAYLYEADDEQEGGILGQIGNTLKKTFSFDDDLDARPNYGYQGTSSWGNWEDDWDYDNRNRGGQHYGEPPFRDSSYSRRSYGGSSQPSYGGGSYNDYRAPSDNRQDYGYRSGVSGDSGNVAYDRRGQSATGYNNQDYRRQGYSGQSYDDQGYGNRSVEDRDYDNPGYSNPRYDDRGYDSRPSDSRPSGNSGYDSAGRGRQGYDSRSSAQRDNGGYRDGDYNRQGNERQNYSDPGYSGSPTANPSYSGADYRDQRYRQPSGEDLNYSQPRYSSPTEPAEPVQDTWDEDPWAQPNRSDKRSTPEGRSPSSNNWSDTPPPRRRPTSPPPETDLDSNWANQDEWL
jgi:molecular chaperone DnaK